MERRSNWRTYSTLLKVVGICGSKGATLNTIMESLKVPKGSASGFVEYIMGSFDGFIEVTKDGPRNSRVYHLSEGARDRILKLDCKSVKGHAPKTDAESSERKLIPITNEKQKEIDLLIVDTIYNSRGQRMRESDITKKLSNKVSPSYVLKQISEMILSYGDFIARDAMDKEVVFIRDYRGLIRVIRPDLEFIKLVVSASHDVEISTKAFPGLGDAVVKKSTELCGQGIYEIHAPNVMNLSRVLMKMRVKGVRILSPCGFEEKIDKSIDEAINESYKLVR